MGELNKMDEPIFDPITYALLKSQMNSDNIQNESETVSGDDLTSAINNLKTAINNVSTKQGVPALSLAEDAEDYFTIVANNINKVNGFVSGLLILQTIDTWSANNNSDIVKLPNGYAPAAYQMIPAVITGSQWSNTGEATNLAYINPQGYILMNWSSAIPSGKFIKIQVNYFV